MKTYKTKRTEFGWRFLIRVTKNGIITLVKRSNKGYGNEHYLQINKQEEIDLLSKALKELKKGRKQNE